MLLNIRRIQQCLRSITIYDIRRNKRECKAISRVKNTYNSITTQPYVTNNIPDLDYHLQDSNQLLDIIHLGLRLKLIPNLNHSTITCGKLSYTIHIIIRPNKSRVEESTETTRLPPEGKEEEKANN